MLFNMSKKNEAAINGGGVNRLLISVTVLGSAGPIRFVVGKEVTVADVIVTALKAYAREGRLPVLGSDVNDFVLYCLAAGGEGLRPWDTIGSFGVRNFMLYRKPRKDKSSIVDEKHHIKSGKGTNHGWKNWFIRVSK